jgi:hypothetical protein
MADSILGSVKKALGISPEYDAFDLEITMHINSAFATLHQLGVGPEEEFFITDDSLIWDDFIGDMTGINSVKTYVVLKVKLIFDPPGTSFVLNAFQEQIKEYEVRLRDRAEEVRNPWVPPVTPDPDETLMSF